MWLYFYYTIHKQQIISTQSCKINRKGDKICYSLGCIRCYTSKFVRKVGEHPVSTLYNLDPYGYCVFTLEIGCLNCSSGQTSLTIRSWKLYELVQGLWERRQRHHCTFSLSTVYFYELKTTYCEVLKPYIISSRKCCLNIFFAQLIHYTHYPTLKNPITSWSLWS